MADFQVSLPVLSNNAGSVATSGQRSVTRRLLGATGAATTGKGEWLNIEGVTWKTFLLRAHDQALALPVGTSVRIDGAVTLDPANADINTQHVALATLNNAAPSFSLEAPFMFIRAVVLVNAGPAPVQVDFHGIGI